MKTKFLIIIFSMFIISVFSQEKEELTIGQIKKEAKEHFDKIKKDKGTLKGSGYNEYMRWEWFWSRRLSDARKLSDASLAFNEYNRQKNLSLSRNLNTLTNSSNYADCYNANIDNVWTPIGPSNFPNGNGGIQYHRGLGRMMFTRFHPSYGLNSNQTLFAGGNSGLWKSIDDGLSWTIAGTDQLNVSAISDLAINSSNPNVMYIATGMGTFGVHRYNGAGAIFDSPYLKSLGIMKTTDGGISWTYSGPFVNQQDFTNNTYRMPKIVMHPQNPSILYTIVFFHSWINGSHWESRVYKTIDSGSNWSKVYETVEGHLNDIKFHPTNPNILYISGNKLYKFIDAQSNLSTLIPEDLTGKLAGWSGGSITGTSVSDFSLKIAVSIGAPNNVYIAGSGTEGGPFSNFESFGRYKYFWISTNSGATFVQKKPEMPTCGYNCGMSSGQDLQGSALAVSSDASTIYFGRTAITKSTDGGNKFVSVNDGDKIHPDNRDISFAPNSNSKFFIANDAGIYMSNDNGATFSQRNNGIQNGWVYKLDIANTPNANSQDKTIVGLHDCSTSFTNHQQDGWNQLGDSWGDDTWVAIDPNNSNIVYSEPQGGSEVFRSTNGGLNSTSYYIGSGGGDWSTPFALDPNNSNRMIIGQRNVWSYNFSTNTQTQLSNFNSQVLPTQSNQIRTLAVAPSNSNHIAIAYREGDYTNVNWGQPNFRWANQILKTTDGGSTWNDITPKGVLVDGVNDAVTSILFHPQNPNKIWITYGSYGDFGYRLKSVFMTVNGGQDWINYSDGLPYMPVNSIVMNNNRINDEEKYIGTDAGIFYRNKYMKKWECYGFGLPSIRIRSTNPILPRINSQCSFVS
jgi:photosystem II stability/assembly factor-like uncharacterized protein